MRPCLHLVMTWRQGGEGGGGGALSDDMQTGTGGKMGEGGSSVIRGVITRGVIRGIRAVIRGEGRARRGDKA